MWPLNSQNANIMIFYEGGRYSAMLLAIRRADMEDNDDIEITGYRQGSPKPSVVCSICQKILPNENALIVHCKERHAGRSAPDVAV